MATAPNNLRTIPANKETAMIKVANGKIKTRIANNFFSRLRGLLWTKALPISEGLLLTQCNSVHTFGMRYAIDVIFLDSNFSVTKIVEHLNTGCIASGKGAKHTLELAAGQAQAKGITLGAVLKLEAY